MTNPQLALLILRLGLGVNMLMHGLTRIFNLGSFAEKMASGFNETVLPEPLVLAMGYFIPVAELLIGLLILSGFWLRWAVFAGGLLMAMLLFGTTLKQDWGTAGSQMIYVLCFYFLLRHLPEKPENGRDLR